MKGGLERRAEQPQPDKRTEGLHRLVAGMKARENFNEKLKSLEQKLREAVLFKAGGLSLTRVMDAIMVSRSLLII